MEHVTDPVVEKRRFGRKQIIALGAFFLTVTIATAFVLLQVEGATPEWWSSFVGDVTDTLIWGALGLGGAVTVGAAVSNAISSNKKEGQ